MGRGFVDQSALHPIPYKCWTGVDYHPLWQVVPALEPLYTDYEKTFSSRAVYLWISDNWWLPLVLLPLYLASCYFGPKVMATRKAFQLDKPLQYWNLTVAILSAVGALRIGLHLLYLVTGGGYSFRDTVCRYTDESHFDNATGLWSAIFSISKVFELLDTSFIIFRKKPLIFLHWYHHTTVLLNAWYGYIGKIQMGLYIMTMNYTVHAIMYLYYYLMAIRAKPKWFNPMWITLLQLAQMAVGLVVVTMTAYYKLFTDEPCSIQVELLLPFQLMYGSYLYLFLQFFYRRFIHTDSSSKCPTDRTSTDSQ